MKLLQVSRLALALCLLALVGLVINGVHGALRFQQIQSEVLHMLEISDRIADFSEISAGLVLNGGDDGLLQSYQAEAAGIRLELDRMAAEHPDAAKAARRVELMVETVLSAVDSPQARDPAHDTASASHVLGISPVQRIVMQRMASESTALATALDDALRERQLALADQTRWISAGLALSAVLFGFGCLFGFGLIHQRISQPVTAIEATLRKIHAGDQGARTKVKGRDELAALAIALNQTLDDRQAAETELRASIEQLEDTRDKLTRSQQIGRMGSWSYDHDTHSFDWSPEALSVLGLERSQAPSHMDDYLALVHEKDREWLVERHHRWKEGRQADAFEADYRVVPDGEHTRRIHERSVRSRHADGRPARTSGILQDISQRHEFYELQLQFKGLLEDSDDLYAILDDDFAYRWVNAAYARSVGIDRNRPCDYSLVERIGKENFDNEIRPRLERCLAGEPQRFLSTRSLQDKGQRTLLVSYSPIELPGGERRIGAVISDITEIQRAEDARQQVSRQLADTLKAVTDAVVIFDQQWRYTYVNEAAEQILERHAAELIGAELWTEYPELLGTSSETLLRRALEDQKSGWIEQYFEPLGIWFETRAYPWEGGVGVFFRDISEEKNMLEELSSQKAELAASGEAMKAVLATRKALIDSLPAHIALLDDQGQVIDVNGRWRDYGEQNAPDAQYKFGVGQNYIEVCRRACGEEAEHAGEVADALESLLAGQRDTFSLEYPCHSPDREQWFRVSANALVSSADASGGAVVMHTDISERVLAEKEINRLAYEDPLTETYSRNGFVQALDRRLDQETSSEKGTVAMVDVIELHDINDAQGYESGNHILVRLSERLRQLVGDQGLVARTGGDEFAIFWPRISSDEDRQVFETLTSNSSEPFDLPDSSTTIGVDLHVGYVELGERPKDAAELLREAELALFENRKDQDPSKAPTPFSSELEEQTRHRIHMTAELGRAVEEEQFELHFQPKVDLARRKLISAEALIRWRHPERGLLSPGLFIPIAEQSQLIGPMGEWALRDACRQLRAWKDRGIDVVNVAVNVSVIQFKRGDFPSKVREALSDFGIEASQLSLEITESVFADQSDRLLGQMRELHDMGVHLSLDDFGTGYSSLLYLQQYPFDEIKIDQGFIRDVLHDPYCRDVVRYVLALADALGSDVVAEGIESEDVETTLLELGCKLGQGYFYSMPLESEDFSWMLDQSGALPLSSESSQAGSTAHSEGDE